MTEFTYHSPEFAELIIDICEMAGAAILDVYTRDSGFEVGSKVDTSPVTEADLAANKIIVEQLRLLTGDIPILTEESSLLPYAERRLWQRYWIVDPLDGTKEFIRHNDQFTVNIALIENTRPVFGVVYVPVTKIAYLGVPGIGATKYENRKPLAIMTRKLSERIAHQSPIDVLASNLHGSSATKAFVDTIEMHIAKTKLMTIGSSLKFCLLAEGMADVYPRLAPTAEWDTAAAQAVLEAAGGKVVTADMSVLAYNKKEDIINPYFVAIADPSYAWDRIILESLHE